MLPFAAMAFVFAASCGNDITGASSSRRAFIVLKKTSFQTTSTSSDGSGGDVSLVRVTISAVSSTASAGAAAHVIADVVINADTVGSSSGNETDTTAGSVTVGFPIQGAGVTYQVSLKAVDATGDTTYTAGPAQFTSNDLTAAGGVTVSLTPVYIGPGANAARVVITPHSATIVAGNGGNSLQLSAQAYSASGAALALANLNWTTLDPSIVSVDGSAGTVFANNVRGTARVVVTAQGSINPSDTALISVSLAASSIVVVSGGGQSGPVGKPLGSPIVVKAVASDGVQVVGTTINFQAQGSGSVSPSSAVTNASGTAQTTWTLGSVVGNQNLSASIPNSPASITVSATGTSSGTGGTGSAQLTLLSNNSIIAAHGTSNIVTVLYQSNGTPIQGGFVAFTPGSTASGSVSASSVTTDASGHASVNWTLGTAPSESLIISASNAATVNLQATVSAAAASVRPTSP